MVISDVNQVTYNGDGITTAWPFTFQIIDATDVKVLLIDTDGLETDITSDFYVDTVNSTVYYPGYAPGSEPPEEDQPPKVQVGQKLTLYRRLPLTQEADLGEKWPFKVIEKGLDKLTMLMQDVYDWAGRNVIGYKNGGWEARNFPIHNVGGPSDVNDAATKDYVDKILSGFVLAGDSRTVPFDNVSQLRSADIEVGQIATTLGYYDINDGGNGIYSIRTAIPGDTDDGGSILILDNGNVAELIVADNTVYFKQWGAKEDGVTDDGAAVTKACAYATANSIAYVKCGGTLVTSVSINVKFNFEFNKINYTGNDYAVVIDSLRDTFITGNRIDTADGSGIKITCTTANCVQNHVDVREIVADNGNCVDVLPVNSRGVMQNHFFFGRLKSSNGKGINSFIPKDTGKYSWEGEDIYAVACAVAKVGVNFEIEPTSVTVGGTTTTDVTDDGTITGVTFLHLSCEYSETGVRIKCGKNTNPNRTSDATIKSITINNMRCRETDRTTMFLDAEGLLKDVYIYPTSPIKLAQWKLFTSYRNACKIIGQITDPLQVTTIGENLCSVYGVQYIERKSNRIYKITSSTTNFGDMCKKFKDEYVEGEDASLRYNASLYMPGIIEISSSVSGAVAIDFSYFLMESAESILLSTWTGQTVTATFHYDSENTTTATISNSTGKRQLYEIKVWRNPYYGAGADVKTIVIRVVNLGEITAF